MDPHETWICQRNPELLTDHIMKDVSLVEVYGDQSLILCPFYPGKIPCGHLNEGVENRQEVLICGSHDLLVRGGIGKGYFCVPCPQKLNTHYTHLL